jgi:CheY-like chemotaxis protein
MLERHVDVIVSDLALRGEDGLSFIRRLRALPASVGGAIPAVALSGLDHALYEDQALAAGFQAYLQKPLDFGELCRVFSRLGLPVDIGFAGIA